MRRLIIIMGQVLLLAGIPVQAATKSPPSEAVATRPDEDTDGGGLTPDGLTNAQEAERGTNPNNPDTDADGILDGSDAMPKNAGMKVLASDESPYAIADLGSEYVPGGINDDGDVLLLREGSTAALKEGAVWSNGVLTVIGEGQAGSFRGPLINGAVYFGSPTETTSETPELLRRISTNKKWLPDGSIVSEGLYEESTSTSTASASALPGSPLRSDVLGPRAAAVQDQAWDYMNSQLVPQLADAVGNGDQTQMISAKLGRTNDEGDHTFAAENRLQQPFLWEVDGWISEPQSYTIAMWINGFKSLLDTYSFNMGAISWVSAFQPSNFPVITLANTWGQKVGEVESHPVVLFSASTYVPIPNAEEIVDITTPTTSEGPYYLGVAAGSLFPTLWCYGNAMFPQQDIDGTLPEIGQANPVTTRRVNNRLLVPLGDAVWQNGHRREVRSLCGSAALAYEQWAISQVSPNKTHLLAQALKTTDGQQHTLLLVPADIAVDANRDGTIRFAGNFQSTQGKPTDKTTETKPFRFWCNDDDDKGALGSEQMPVANPDNNDNQIGSVRDLEDFFRLYVHVGAFYDELSNGTFKIGLKWKSTNGTSPVIKVYKSADPSGSDDYLKNEQAGQDQFAAEYRTAIATVSGNSTAILPPDLWTGYSESNPKRCLLFEGITEGKGQLCITIHKADGTPLGEGPGVWFDLKNIKKMYQRVDSATAHPWENVAFEADPNEDKKDAVIFVHGWRMSPEGAGNFAETMFKRMWHRGFKGRFVAFHWDTWWHDGSSWVPWAGEAIDAYLARYNDSEKIAWQSGTALMTFVNNLSFDHKNIVAHSMGNIVAGQALVEGMAIQNYALLQAAVPSACYDDDETRIKQTSQYLHHAGALFFNMWDSPTPDADADPATKNLAYRGTFQNVAGNLVNFYLPDDQATSFAWEINNDQTKPPLYQGENSNASLCFNYEYHPSGQPGEKLLRFEISALYPSYYVTSKPEAMSYACRTWGKAVGAWGATDGSLNGSPVNLKGPEFGGPRGFDTEHSAEFSRRIQQLKPFYDRLLDELEVKRNNP